MSVSAIILAAGEGSRMKSDLPKPLHLVGNHSMLLHVVHSLENVQLDTVVVVVGHRADEVMQHVRDHTPPWANVSFATQQHQHGTGDAVTAGLTALDNNALAATIIVLPGDTPLLTRETISRLVTEHEQSDHAATVLVSDIADPTGYGRIVRTADGNVARIVEHRDASKTELELTEINTGIYAFRADLLGPALSKISTNNSQAEYYLTDVVAILTSADYSVGAVLAPGEETAGVNDRDQLVAAELVLVARTRLD
jgi:bifunctional UDP-N-acetylglucosamine pyrophosphorylase/glucosamine-1-phosphate N-acetyltransferase